MKNKYGLSRDMPDKTKREVRKRCGFGCVICGNAIYQYEHFNPEFSDAVEHKSSGITLLCGSCHDRKTRGLLSLRTLIYQNENPKALENGFSWGPLDVGPTSPIIIFGSFTIQNTPIILRAYGEDLFKFEPPSEEGSPFLVSAMLQDRNGIKILNIVNNEIQIASGNWDFEITGNNFLIRSEPRKIELLMQSMPPNKIIIKTLEMRHRDCLFSCGNNVFKIIRGSRITQITDTQISGARCAVDISQKGTAYSKGPGARLSVGSIDVSPLR